MTPRQIQTEQTRNLRFHAQQERLAKRQVLVRFRLMAARLTQWLDQSGPQTLAGAVETLITEADHLAMLERVYVPVGTQAAQREYDRLLPPAKNAAVIMQLKERDGPDIPRLPTPPPTITVNRFSETWRQRMILLARSAQSALRVTNMTAHSRQLVRDVLTRGAFQRWDVRKIGRKLRSALIDPVRALLIARTETTRAASAGAEAGAESTGILLDKIWLATADLRTRPSHLAMLKSPPVPRDGFFLVSGLPMLYPGDPAGGKGETCNCRCSVGYVPRINPFL